MPLIFIFCGFVIGLFYVVEHWPKSRRKWPYPRWTDSPWTIGGKVLVFAEDKRKLYKALFAAGTLVLGFLALTAWVALIFGVLFL